MIKLFNINPVADADLLFQVLKRGENPKRRLIL